MTLTSSIRDQLKSAYTTWKHAFDDQNIDVTAFSPPLLVSASEQFVNANRKVLVFGQETFGWSWTNNIRNEQPDHQNDFPYTNLNSLADFLHNQDSIDALLWAYERFAFAKDHSASRSPFWRAFRQLNEIENIELLWTNVIKCDYEGGTILQLPLEERVSFLNQQNTLVRSEIEIIAPHATVFFSGPYYDDFLREIFPGLKIEAVEGEKMLSRLHHTRLPSLSFRTYHPAYLSRAKLWKHVDLIADAL